MREQRPVAAEPNQEHVGSAGRERALHAVTGERSIDPRLADMP